MLKSDPNHTGVRFALSNGGVYFGYDDHVIHDHVCQCDEWKKGEIKHLFKEFRKGL